MASRRGNQGTTFRSFIAACVLLGVFGLVATADVYEQCGIVPDDSRVKASGEMKALVVFARFKDDNIRSWNNGWPMTEPDSALSKDVLPVWADSLVEDVSPPGFPTIEGSLTHRLHYASRGNLRFNGTVYESVVVLDKTMAEYVAISEDSSLAVMQEAAVDVLDSLVSWGYDFSQHVNVSAADTLDYFAICFRGVRTFYSSGDSAGTLQYALNRCCTDATPRVCANHTGIAFWFSHTFGDGYKIVPGRTTAMFGQNDRALWQDYNNIWSPGRDGGLRL